MQVTDSVSATLAPVAETTTRSIRRRIVMLASVGLFLSVYNNGLQSQPVMLGPFR